MKNVYWLIVGCLLAQNVQAQAPVVTGVAPGRNGETTNRAANVAVTFSQPLNANPSSTSLRVFSSQRGGRLTGTLSVSSNMLVYDPTREFRVGEELSVTTSTAVQGSNGVSLATPQVYRFRVRPVAGPGTFAAGTDVAIGTQPTFLATADVDGDGDLDFLAANQNSNTVSLRLNNGRASFSNGADIPVGTTPTTVATADVDGDGDLDMLCSNRNSATVSVRLNNGSGLFGGGADVAVSATPVAVTTADVDGDGDLDLIAGSRTTPAVVSIRLNNGSGTFSGGADVQGRLLLTAVTTADIDNDGDLDVLATEDGIQPGNTGGVLVLHNNGLGTFAQGTAIVVAAEPQALTVGDIDGDGDVDLVTANRTPGTASVRLNNGAGLFSGSTELNIGSSGKTVALADVDGDGDLDLLAGSNSTVGTSVFFNNGAGVFGSPATYYVPAPFSLAPTDLDGDGDLDMLIAEGNSNTVGVFINNGSGAPLAAQARLAPVPVRIEVWPNPGHESIQINGLGSYEEAQLLNAVGQVVAHITANANGYARLQLPAALPAGVYLVKASHNRRTITIE